MGDDVYKKIFSSNLKYLMEINDKTQLDLINDLGFNKSAVSTWCNGTRLPRMDKVDILAKYFGVLRSDLIEDKSKEQEPGYYIDKETSAIAEKIKDNKELKLLFDTARDSSPEDIQTVHQMLLALKRKEKNEDDE